MRIGLIDVDSHNYPNLPLMKLSAWHKAQGDHVEWYEPMWSGHMDIVYMSKVFSFTEDYLYPIDADKIIKGGSGYCISLKDGKEVFDKSKDIELPYEIEHIYPDYSIYGITDTAYGFLTRGCPRGCSFCHVKTKEGGVSYKVADINEFWKGQKKIELLDPNILACKESEDLLEQIAETGAEVNFNQGLDIRFMAKRKVELLNQIKMKRIHFAWDRYEDKDIIQPKLKLFAENTTSKRLKSHNLMVYVLCGDREKKVLPEDLERIYWLRDMGYKPYVMLYDKDNIPKGHELRHLQRYVNNDFIFWRVPRFEDYKS